MVVKPAAPLLLFLLHQTLRTPAITSKVAFKNMKIGVWGGEVKVKFIPINACAVSRLLKHTWTTRSKGDVMFIAFQGWSKLSRHHSSCERHFLEGDSSHHYLPPIPLLDEPLKTLHIFLWIIAYNCSMMGTALFTLIRKLTPLINKVCIPAKCNYEQKSHSEA